MAATQRPRLRDQRLEARLTPDQKEMIERAAFTQGRTVTDFVVTVLREAARKAIENDTVWQLSQTQQKAFADGLMKPPAPGRNLKEAYGRYKKYKALQPDR